MDPLAAAESARSSLRLRVSPWRDPTCSRTLVVRGDASCLDLHGAIQQEFELDNDHLWAIYPTGDVRDRSLSLRSDDPKAWQMPLARLELSPGRGFLYRFDLGNDLRHDVEVLAVEPTREGAPLVECVDRVGTPPAQYPVLDEDEQSADADEGERGEQAPHDESPFVMPPGPDLLGTLDAETRDALDAERIRRAVQDDPGFFFPTAGRSPSPAQGLARDERIRLARLLTRLFERTDEALLDALDESHGDLAAWARDLTDVLSDDGMPAVGFPPLPGSFDRGLARVLLALLRSMPVKGLHRLLGYRTALALAYLGQNDEAKAAIDAVRPGQGGVAAEVWGTFRAAVFAACGEEARAINELIEGVDRPWVSSTVVDEGLPLLARLLRRRGRDGEIEPLLLRLEARRRSERELLSHTVRREVKVGRNDPCPCGSGRKSKKCHGA